MTEEMKTAVLREHRLYHAIYSALHNYEMGQKKQRTNIASTPASNTPTPNASLSPYHPNYGLTDDTRIRALLIAETSGVKAAAEELNVAVSTVYRWRSDYATSASNT